MSDKLNSKWRLTLSWIIIFVHFGQALHLQYQPSTLLQNSIYLRQSAAEILLFVQKSKMAEAAILDLIFV